MNVTESRFKNRQLHMEDYLQMVSAEQKEYAEVFDYSKITEKSGVITDYWTNNLLDLILRKDNLNSAYKQVKKNKGKGGIDGMQVDELLPFLRENQETLIQEIRGGNYKPNPVRRVEIPKETKGEYRKLGVPTVVDRVVPFPVSWTVKMKKKQKETQDILSYHTQAAGCSDKARAKASGGRQPIEECGRTGL